MTGSDADFGTSTDRLEAVVEHAFDAIAVADDDGRYVDANPAPASSSGSSARR